MKKRFSLPIISLSLLLLGWGLIWFKGISYVAIEPDEVVWVLDARFYKFRQQKHLEKFSLSNKAISMGWAQDQYRLIDQPQLGKYVYGLIISSFQLNPWDDAQARTLYQGFVKKKLDFGDLNEVGGDYHDLAESIRIIRILGSITSFIAIIGFGFGAYLLTKSKSIGSLTSTLLFLHPILFYSYRLAVPNNLQIVLLLSSLGLMFYLLPKVKAFDFKKVFWWAVVGMLVAASTSIKLNGAFLLFFPIIIWIMEEIRLSFIQKNIGKNITNQIKYILALGSGFLTTFYFLEPELWNQPFFGFKLLFKARLLQHQRFMSFYQDYSFIETIWVLLEKFLRISSFIPLKIVVVFCLLWGIKVVIKKLANKNWRILSWLLILIVIANTSYANVGFDRYAEWSIFVFSFLSALGGVDILQKIDGKIRQL
jgi:hypothetical protein